MFFAFSHDKLPLPCLVIEVAHSKGRELPLYCLQVEARQWEPGGVVAVADGVQRDGVCPSSSLRVREQDGRRRRRRRPRSLLDPFRNAHLQADVAANGVDFPMD